MADLKIEYVKLSEIKPYKGNAKTHPKEQVEQIKKSIQELGFNDPIGIWHDEIVEGHGRYFAAQELGLDTVPVIRLDRLTDEQRRAYTLIHNKLTMNSDFDFDLLNIELEGIFDIDMGDFGFELEDDSAGIDDVEHSSLNERFIVPPFSVLDTRQGYWQERKKAWKGLGIESENGRGDSLIGVAFKKLGESINFSEESAGVSIFDPVLCELMYKWFCPKNGKIYDPFAGGSVRGIVAQACGFNYFGIELRKEQVESNIEQAKKIGVSPTWCCDDSANAEKYIQRESVDMIFSCPPYADLEKYSDDPRDLSNMDYKDFCQKYADIIRIAVDRLKENRFAIFVVGEIRDKKGFFRGFVDYTTECFEKSGARKYNEIILLNVVGSASRRARAAFRNRKCVKVHQNVLVFYKGDPKKIKENYGEIEIDDSIFDDYEEE